MKYLTVLLLVAFVVGVYSDDAADANLRAEQKAAEDCIKETEVKPDAVKNLLAGDFTDKSEKIQCYTKCFLQKLGFIDDSGVVQESVAIDTLSIGGDRAKVTMDVNQCKSEKGDSVCETAHKLYKCYNSIKP